MKTLSLLHLFPLAAVICLASLGPIHAQQQIQGQAPAPKCPEEAQPIPEELSGWTARSPIIAAADPAHLGAAMLHLGKGADATLLPTPEVTYAVRPVKPGGKVSSGGMFEITLDHAGVYRVALDTRAWIDVVVAGKPTESLGHSGGPACSGMRKIVDYALPAGTHVIQLSAAEAKASAILVTERK
ncbi:hypothetical protein C8J30_11113 [Rhodobacter viridis]|uniref:Homogentisate 1,2-dioxygenase n=1 Tax=Rhodobacter viridis TaxID=1054202 RepID=A0A318U2S1_9RHOB|nr:homogentisate 1,2-dioxygenase [Rhodobacter viridis]PYF08685.1 hypothetical protein C8J30_11113 [Rhodobacter viridis]